MSGSGKMIPTVHPKFANMPPSIAILLEAFFMRCKYYERKDRAGRWVVYLNWSGRRYKRSHYDDQIPLIHEEMARQIAAAINADIKHKGKQFDPRQWFRTSGHEFQFSVYVDKWLMDQAHYAPSVVRDVHRYVGYFKKAFGHTDIREIKRGHIDDFMKTLPGHLSPKTRKNILTLLHKIFSDAFSREDILRIPGFPSIETQESEIVWIGREWQDRIIAEISERDRPIFIFIRTYGVRPGEARALQWDCVDFDKGIITIKRTWSGSKLRDITKNRKIRYLPIIPEIEVLLKSIRALGGFVFRNRFGRHYQPDISRIWNEARDKVGAPSVTLYQGTRHSLGCQKLSEGHNLEHIRELFGHSRDDMTRRYAKASLETIKKLVE
jgi:integrase